MEVMMSELIEDRLREIREVLNSVGLSIVDANADYENRLRDQFAMAALPAIIRNKGIQTPPAAAEVAYAVADAMMKERGAK
jgi:hypothetical protein